VGAGVLGLAHALEARRRGLSVVVLERDSRAAGGSIRGLGHLFFSALAPGAALDAAESGRERWLELARRCGILIEGRGTVIVARRAQELTVLETAAAEPGRQARILGAAEIGSLAPIPLRGVLGGLHSRIDLRIDPRAGAGRIARLLERDPHARIEWNTPVHGFEPGAVHTQSLRVRAEAVVICTGAGSVVPGSPNGGLTVRRLQLLRVAAPTGKRYRSVLMSGAGMLTYPAFAQAPGAAELRGRLELERPELVERGVRVRIAQLPNGDLIAGDTQTYIEHEEPFASERADALLLDELQELLGVRPAVRQRWQTTYAVDPSRAEDGPGRAEDELLITAPCRGVRVVKPTGELAMTLCHTRAGELLDELFFGAGPSAASSARALMPAADNTGPYMVVRDLRRTDGVRAHAEAFRRRGSSTPPHESTR
jgi:FAD dependent oxidoreductase TIGR03364